MKKAKDREIDQSFFNAMSYELAGDIGAIDNEEMKNNKKLIVGKKAKSNINKSK